jgi:hypothetical protein
MRCYNYKCRYNDSGYCGQPDYVIIDENGKCEQADVTDSNPKTEAVEE